MTSGSFARRLLASLASGIATGLVVFLAVGILIYVTGATALEVAQNFGPSAVVLIVVTLVTGLLGATAKWLRSLAAGVVAGILAPYFGVVILLSLTGGEFTASSDAAFRDLLTFNLAFFVATVIVTLTVARRVYDWAFGLRVVAPPQVHRVALVRAPATSLAKGELTHLKRKPVKYPKAMEQWQDYVAALEAEGFRVVRVDADDDYPDCVFIEDMVVMLGQVAVLTSPGADSRKGEQDAVEAAVLELGLETRRIRLPGTLDGGDVLKVGTTIYVGQSSRTNGEGIRQLRAIGSELGFEVVGVPVTKALHLKSSVTALPDGTVIGHESLVDNPSIFRRYLPIPEPEGVAVVVLTNNTVLVSASAPKTAALLADLGYRVTAVQIGEFEKLEGCVTCLSVRIR